MPQTRWWRCRPPAFTPAPGHQEQRRRVSLALVRIARNDTRNATSTSSAAPRAGPRPRAERVDADDLGEDGDEAKHAGSRAQRDRRMA